MVPISSTYVEPRPPSFSPTSGTLVRSSVKDFLGGFGNRGISEDYPVMVLCSGYSHPWEYVRQDKEVPNGVSHTSPVREGYVPGITRNLDNMVPAPREIFNYSSLGTTS